MCVCAFACAVVLGVSEFPSVGIFLVFGLKVGCSPQTHYDAPKRSKDLGVRPGLHGLQSKGYACLCGSYSL